MALHILNEAPVQRGSFATGLASGIGQGLSALAQNKLGEIQNQKRAKAWENIGLDPELANFIVQQPESIQRDILARMENFGSAQSNQLNPNVVPDTINQTSNQKNNLIIGKSKAAKEEEAKKFKESKEFRKQILKDKRDAGATLKDLGRLEELSRSGKLDTPGYAAFLERSGLDIPSLMTPESQEFAKIQQGFLKNAKQYFGSRISNFEVEQFLKTIPSLSQSPEGRARVIAGLKKIERGKEEYYKAYEDVLRENGGVPPYDVEEQVERKAEKRLDRIYEEFEKDLKKPTPKGQNKFITALQAGIGSSVKPLSKAAGSALTGAAVGSIFPGIGTAAGGIAGGLGGIGAHLAGLI